MLNEIIGELLRDDVITGEEAIILLKPRSEDINEMEEKLRLVNELMFGEIITPEEAVQILEGEIPFWDDDDEMDDYFNADDGMEMFMDSAVVKSRKIKWDNEDDRISYQFSLN